MNQAIRIGLGYDSHRLESGGPLRIGGLDIPADVHAVGHSDADVLLHAITDALLGAVCQEDIGRLFPDSDAENQNRDSFDFLLEAVRRVASQGYAMINLDCVVLAEHPRMAPHIDAMRIRIAEQMNIEIDQISIKAKTGEGVGEIGNRQAIATRVVVLLGKSPSGPQ